MERAALRLLALREHARAELRRKLLARGFATDLVDSVLVRLARADLQSDERFTEHFVAQRRVRGQGPQRIRAELQQRGIDRELIDAWVDPADRSWRDLMLKVLAERFGAAATPADRRELARRARFLQYRGFPDELIRGALLD